MKRTSTPDEPTAAPGTAGGDSLAMVRSLDAHRHALARRDRRQIPAEDLEPIVRRAAELQNRDGNPGAQLLTEEEVVEIGRQVGLGADCVRRAIAEVHAESLAPKPPPGNRILDLVAGESRAEVRRVVAGDPALIQQQLEGELREREKLRALRRRPRRSVWEASSGAMDRLERFLNFSGREYALAETAQVDLAVAEFEPGWSLVTIAADVSNKRAESFYGISGGVGALAILAGVLGAEGGLGVPGVLAGLGAGLLGAAIGVPWLRRTVQERRARIALVLEGLLDRVDR